MDYQFQIDSDVMRDGLGLELIELKDSARTVIAEVFNRPQDSTLGVGNVELEVSTGDKQDGLG